MGALLMSFNASWAQEPLKVTEVKETKQIAEWNAPLTGISANGRYLWANTAVDRAFVLDTQTEKAQTFGEQSTDEFGGGFITSVMGITDDGTVLVAEGETSCKLVAPDGRETALQSPSEEFPWVQAWAITPDGSLIVGNLANDAWGQAPFYATRNQDGSYRISLLPNPTKDVFGLQPNYTQAKCIAPDGQTVIGSQNNYYGVADRLIVWTKGADGHYAYSYPADPVLYDKNVVVPPDPVYEDYVTIEYYEGMPDDELAKLEEQEAEYNKAVDEMLEKRTQFTQGLSLDALSLRVGRRGSYLYSQVVKDEDYTASAFVYDLQQNKATLYPEVPGLALETFPGGFLVGEGFYPMYSLSYLKTEDNSLTPLHEWLKTQTGTDLTDQFTYTLVDPETMEKYDGVFLGQPFMAADGKSLTLGGETAVMEEGDEYPTYTYFMRTLYFNKDLFAQEEATDAPLVVATSYWDGTAVRLQGVENGFVTLFDVNGNTVGRYSDDGSGVITLAGVVPAGRYIALVGGTNISRTALKVMVR